MPNLSPSALIMDPKRERKSLLEGGGFRLKREAVMPERMGEVFHLKLDYPQVNSERKLI